MIASAAIFNENDSIYLPPPPARGLPYYLDLGKYYRRQRETLNRGEWNDHKREQGNFLDKCLNIIDGWDKLAKDLQNALLNLDYPSYLTATAVNALFKVPAEIMGECLERLKTLIEGGKPLTSKDIEKTARLFHTKRKNYLVIEEVVTEDDWELVARKYRALKDPARLDLFKEEARRLAGNGTIFTEHVIEALSNFGHDPAKILPKPKKKYSDRDLEAATAPIERERDSLKSENAALKRLLEHLGVPFAVSASGNDSVDSEEGDAGRKGENSLPIARVGEFTGENELSSLGDPAENEDGGTSPIELKNGTTFEREKVLISGSVFALPPVSLDDGRVPSVLDRTMNERTDEPSVENLKGRQARTRLGRALTLGELVDHNASLNTWLFRSGAGENARTFFLKAKTIEVESPPGSDIYRNLAEILDKLGNGETPGKSLATSIAPTRKREKTKGFGKI